MGKPTKTSLQDFDTDMDWECLTPDFDDGSENKLRSNVTQDAHDRSEDVTYSDPDLALISELIENIESSPHAQEPRVLLMQHYAICGWHDAAKEEARQALKVDRNAKEARSFLETSCKITQRVDSGNRRTKARPAGFVSKSNKKFPDPTDCKNQRAQPPKWRPSLVQIESLGVSLKELEDGYVALLKDAELLLNETKLLKQLRAPVSDHQTSDLIRLSKGHINSVVRSETLEGVKKVAEAIVADDKEGSLTGLSAAMKDLEKLAKWLKKPENHVKGFSKGKSRSTGSDEQDQIREALVKRVNALKALLPESLQPIADLALMHADHEILHREYVNQDTFVALDPVTDIPRENFWSSEDGYAWDMAELAGWIKSGKGIMRNPLSKQMFSRADIRAILQHPLGKGLQALGVEQSKLRRGVRPQTIDELDTLAKVLLKDMTEDGKPSHLATEAFVSYLETLPRGEQKAIDDLKVPAKDSHTGIPFDSTIGQTVKDIQGNRVCSHKAGDFLAQAVKYLR